MKDPSEAVSQTVLVVRELPSTLICLQLRLGARDSLLSGRVLVSSIQLSAGPSTVVIPGRGGNRPGLPRRSGLGYWPVLLISLSQTERTLELAFILGSFSILLRLSEGLDTS